MEMHFTLDDRVGYLDWRVPRGVEVKLTEQQAEIIAAAETAAAIRSVAAAILHFATVMGGSNQARDGG